jgi:hypothetical protein
MVVSNIDKQQYNLIIETIFHNQIQQLKKITDNKQSCLITISSLNLPHLFLDYLSEKTNFDKTIDTVNDLTSRQYADLIEDRSVSSFKYLNEPGFELWYVDQKSDSRIKDIFRKKMAGKNIKNIIFLVSDPILIGSVRNSKIQRITISQIDPSNNKKILDYFYSSLGINTYDVFQKIYNKAFNLTITELYALCIKLKETIIMYNNIISKTHDYYFTENFYFLLLNELNISEDYPSNNYFADFIKTLKTKSNSYGVKSDEILDEYMNGKELDNLYYINKSYHMKLLEYDAYNGVLYNPMSLSYYDNHVEYYNIKKEIQTMIIENSSNNIESDVLSSIALNELLFKMDLFLFNTGSKLSFFGILLRDYVENLFTDSTVNMSDIRQIVSYVSSDSPSDFALNWSRALDLYQDISNKFDDKKLLFIIFNAYYSSENKLYLTIFNKLNDQILGTNIKRLKVINNTKSEMSQYLKNDALQSIIELLKYSQNNIRLSFGQTWSDFRTIITTIKEIIYNDIDATLDPNITAILFDTLLIHPSQSIEKYNIMYQLTNLKIFLLNRSYYNSVFSRLDSFGSIELKNNENHYSNVQSLMNDSLIILQHLTNNDAFRDNVLGIKYYADFHKFYHQFHQNAITHKDTVLSSLSIKKIILDIFNKTTEELPNLLNNKIFDDFDDILLIIIDGMPASFTEYFKEQPSSSVIIERGFAIAPSETGPGHMAIFSGLSPNQSKVVENNTRSSMKDRKMLGIESIMKTEAKDIKELYELSFVNELVNTGINVHFHIPNSYNDSLLTNLLLGKNKPNVSINLSRENENIYAEAKVIPHENGRNFYVIMDGQIDHFHHENKNQAKYYFDLDQMTNIEKEHQTYYNKIMKFIPDIYRNASQKNKKLLTIITSDHGVSIQKRKNNQLSTFFAELGLQYIPPGRDARITVYGAENGVVGNGLVSSFDVALFARQDLYESLNLSRNQIQQSVLAKINMNTINDPKRNIVLYFDESIENYMYLKIKCNQCGNISTGIERLQVICEACHSMDVVEISRTSLSKVITQKSSSFGFNIEMISENNDWTNLRTPSVILYPNMDETIAEYPKGLREEIVYILKSNLDGVSSSTLYSEWINTFNKSKPFFEFDEEVNKLINLHIIEDSDKKLLLNTFAEYSGECLFLSHGGISPTETIIPFIFITRYQ